MRAVAATLAVGLASTALALMLVLSKAPLALVGTDAVQASAYREVEHGPLSACQPVGAIPRGTSAIRVAIEARAVGPAVSAAVLAGGRVLGEGFQPAGWGSAPTVTVPIPPLARSPANTRVCLTIGASVEPFRLHGVAAPVPGTGGIEGMRLRMEYLRPGGGSWWSLLPAIATHIGIGQAGGGAWIALLALGLMLGVAALTARIAIRELR